MKKIFLILVLLSFLFTEYNYPHDLRTPRGKTVEHSHPSDTGWYGTQGANYGYYTQEQWSVYSDELFYSIPKERIDRANKAYNCHAYAWADATQSDPNTFCWINTPGDNTYFETAPVGDESYDEVSSTVATHANYPVQDHSLRLTGGTFNGGPEVFSKWGAFPLYRHRLLVDCYNESPQNVRYFCKSVDVPEDQSSINSAVSLAATGQTINVSSGNYSLSGSISLSSGVTLNFKSGSDVDLNGNTVLAYGGTINIEYGAIIRGTCLKQGSGSILGLYPTIQSACDAAGSGQWVELQARTYNESFSVSNKNNLNVSGYSATINGNVSLNNSSYCHLYGFHLSNGSRVYVSGGTSNLIMDTQADNPTGVLSVNNSTTLSVQNFTAVNGDINEFGCSIYSSTGDICAGSDFTNHLCGIYLESNWSFHVNKVFSYAELV